MFLVILARLRSVTLAALRTHVGISNSIMMPVLIASMDLAVTLNNKVCFTTIEISKIIAKLMLPSEFESEQLAISQALPEQRLCVCCVLSLLLRHLTQSSRLIAAAIVPCFLIV